MNVPGIPSVYTLGGRRGALGQGGNGTDPETGGSLAEPEDGPSRQVMGERNTGPPPVEQPKQSKKRRGGGRFESPNVAPETPCRPGKQARRR